MVDITIVNGDYFMVYKSTYNWGAPSCRGLAITAHFFMMPRNRWKMGWKTAKCSFSKQLSIEGIITVVD